MLTKKQKLVLDYITLYTSQHGISPSHDDIRSEFKLSSVSTAHHYITALQNKGYISRERNSARSLEVETRDTLIKVPFRGFIAAGSPIEVVEEYETISVPSNFASKTGNLFALGVKGDSMIDEGIFDGDTVIIREQSSVEDGEVAVALINNNEVTLKKIFREKNRIRLQPANPKLKPIYVKDVIIQGKVISTFRNIEERELRENKIKLNTIYNENCLETMKRMPDNFVDVVLTSPPYDNMRDYKGYSFDFEKIAKELYRTIKDGGVVIWVIGDATIKGSETGTSFRQALYFKEIGFNLFDTMIYLKPPRGAVGNNKTYWQTFEYMFILSKGNPKTINLIKDRENKEERDGDRSTKRLQDGSLLKLQRAGYSKYGRRTNVWEYLIGKGHSATDKIAYEHPAIFPEKLAQDHIISWSKETEIVYDPFMGSGTTAKMAIINKRNYIGSELSLEYCKITQKRIQSLL